MVNVQCTNPMGHNWNIVDISLHSVVTSPEKALSNT